MPSQPSSAARNVKRLVRMSIFRRTRPQTGRGVPTTPWEAPDPGAVFPLDPRMSTLRRIAALALLSLAALVPAASADAAQTLTFKGKERKGVVEFRAGKLKNKKVRKLSARVNGRQVKLSATHKRRV